MRMLQFVLMLRDAARDVAKEQGKPVLAVDFEPRDGDIFLTFRFKEVR